MNSPQHLAAAVFQLGTNRAWLSRLWCGAHVAVVLVLAPVSASAANDGWNENEAELARDPKPPPPPPPPPLTPVGELLAASLVCDVELRAVIGWATLGDEDGSRAELTTGGADVTFNMGAFVTPHVKMGYEATFGKRQVLESRPGEQNGVLLPSETERDATFFLPIGGHAGWYPLGDAGLSFGVHLGLGVFWGADYMGGGFFIPVAATAAVDIGYDHVLSRDLALGVRARCGALGLANTDDDGDTTTLDATEVGLAVHLTAF